jgi:hypothetical protein
MQSLAELAAGNPALWQDYDKWRTAYVLQKPMPVLTADEPPHPSDWFMMLAAMQDCFEVMACARADDTVGAWRAAAAASYWRGAAETLMHPEAVKLLANARSFRDVGIKNVSGANQNRRDNADEEALKSVELWCSSPSRRASLDSLSPAERVQKYLRVSRPPRRQAARLRAMLTAGKIK